jgi:hypothetical protein
MAPGPNLLKALERIAILREDCRLTEREIDKRGLLSERALRDWISGRVHEISRQRVEPLEHAVLSLQCVPWSKHHYGVLDQMWQAYRRGGQQAVIKSLRAEYKDLPNKSDERARVKRDLARARAKPEWAFDIDPSVYRQGAARRLADDFEHYAELMQDRFSAGFPHPSEARPEDWTTVLLLLQFFRDAGAVVAPGDDDLMPRLRAWLSLGCALHPLQTWSQILAYRLAEEQLIAAWPDSSLEERKQILADLRWFDLTDGYTAVVQGNITVARNALSAASATLDRTRYRKWYRQLLALDSRWKFPQRMRELNEIDSDFDDFVSWWQEVGSKDETSPHVDSQRNPMRTVRTSRLALYAAAIVAGIVFTPAALVPSASPDSDEPTLARVHDRPSFDVDTSRTSSAVLAPVIQIADIRPSGPFMQGSKGSSRA